MTLAVHPGEMILERLLRELPQERDRLLPYVDRARTLAGECGCAMGGAFMVAAAALVAAYSLSAGVGPFSLLGGLLGGAGFIFCATILGKLLGVAIARLRLSLLYCRLERIYSVAGA